VEEEGGEAAAAPGRDSNMSDASQASTASQAADARAAIFAQMQAAEAEAAEAPRPAPAATGGPAALKKWQQQEQPKGDEKRVRAVNLERVKVEGSSQHAEAMRNLKDIKASIPKEKTNFTARDKAMMKLENKAMGRSPASTPGSSPAGSEGRDSIPRASNVRKAKEGLFAAAEKEPESKLSQAEEAKRKLANLGVVDKKVAYGVKSKTGSQHAKAMANLRHEGGVDTTKGSVAKSELVGKAPVGKAPPPKTIEGSQASKARAAFEGR